MKYTTSALLSAATIFSACFAGEIPFSGKIMEIDFSPNEFHLPETFHMKNCVPNSSFEEGLEGWQTGTWGQKTTSAATAGFRRFAELDETTARTGKRSLKINFGKGNKPSVEFFAVATEPGAVYTFSFYGKASVSGITARIRGTSDRWDHFPPALAFRMGTGWIRYTHTFKAPGKMLTLQVGADESSRSGSFWIDDVQFEKSESVTAYSGLSLGVALETADPMNLTQPGEKAGVKLRVRSAVPGKGTVSCRIYDFFRKTVLKKSFPFETANAYEPVYLEIPECDQFPSGVYIAEVTAKTENGAESTSWKRFVRMNFLDGTHWNKNLFSGVVLENISPAGDWADFLAFRKKAGIGSLVSFLTPTPEYQALLKENGISYCGMLFNTNEWKSNLGSRFSFGGAYLWNARGRKSLVDFPDSEIPVIVEDACRIIRANPDANVFKTVNEPHTVTEAETAKLIRILKAIRAEAEKIRPDIVILTPDCANISTAIPYLELFFRLGGAEACHAIGVHLYQGDPDINDENLRAVIALSDRYYGKDSKVYQTEGGYYMPVRIPDLRLNGFFCGDNFRAGSMSYDVSRGERGALAAQLRFRLATLKHSKRVTMDVDWNWAGVSFPQFGLEGIPNGIVFAVNTPARLLGNSEFAADIKRPGGNPRGYIFVNDFSGGGYGTGLSGKVPVAALYSLQSGRMDVSGFPESTHFFDALGKRFEPENSGIQLSELCIFIAAPGLDAKKLKELCEKTKTEIRFKGNPLACTHTVSADGKLKLTFTNRGAKLLEGKLSISLPSEYIDYNSELVLKPDARVVIPFEIEKAKRVLSEKTMRVTFTPEKGRVQSFSPGTSIMTIRKAGPAFQNGAPWTRWNPIPASALRPRFNRVPANLADRTFPPESRNFRPSMKMAWDERNLYLFFDVRDDVFLPSPTPQYPSQGDCIQFFFDPLCDAKSLANYEDDDHWYEVLFPAKKGPQVFRRRAAQWQMAFNNPGLVSKVRSLFRKTADGYQCQFVFPAKECAPVLLRKGASFGFAPQIFDVDVFRFRTAIAGPGNMEILSWRGPLYYFKVFLTE